MIYVGVDPGKYGAIAAVTDTGLPFRWWRMPVTDFKAKGKDREYDVPGIWNVFNRLTELPAVTIGLENPTTRPGEGAERSRWFGQVIGYLEMAIVGNGLDYKLVSPNAWKGGLGLDGKSHKGAEFRAMQALHTVMPDTKQIVTRHTVDSGLTDAFLIAYWMQGRTVEGLRATAEQFGSDSVEMYCKLFQGKRRKPKGPPI